MTTQRTTTEILADLTAARTALSASIAGQRVVDVWEDGSRVRFSTMSVAEIREAIAMYEREYEAAAAVEAGRPRRRVIGLGWAN